MHGYPQLGNYIYWKIQYMMLMFPVFKAKLIIIYIYMLILKTDNLQLNNSPSSDVPNFFSQNGISRVY